MSDKPSFDDILARDEEALRARLEVVRAALTHAGEKGRALESATTQVLREILPLECGLSTGFVVANADAKLRLSPQLDIIVYDATRCGPLIRLDSCDVFPLEAVFGYIEVKARLRSSNNLAKPSRDSLEDCIRINSELGTMTDRRFWRSVVGSAVNVELVKCSDIRMRSFVVAFSATGPLAKPHTFAKRMADVSKHYGETTHVHGVLVLGQGYYRTRPINPGQELHHVQYTTEAPFSAFRADLLTAFARFPRIPESVSPALDQYFKQAAWSVVTPASAT
jgi:hypothetical protein